MNCDDLDYIIQALNDAESAIETMSQEHKRLQAESESLRADAELYRWLRAAGAWESEIGMEILSQDPQQFDAAVDAARKA